MGEMIKFIDSYEKKDLKGAQLAYNSGNVNIHSKNEEAFVWSCHYGSLDITKWLYSLGNVNIHIYSDRPFRNSCRYGHLEIAQWLYSLGNVDIHAENEDAFIGSSTNGHLEIAQWLYSLGNINIYVRDKLIFKQSYGRELLEICKWLVDIEVNLNDYFKIAVEEHRMYQKCDKKVIEYILNQSPYYYCKFDDVNNILDWEILDQINVKG